MLIKEWLPEAIERHRRRHPGGWPEPDGHEGKRLSRDWLNALITEHVHKAEFDAASRQLETDGITFGEDQLPRLLELIRANRTQTSRRAAIPISSDRETAERDSRGCAHCDGGGLATVYHPLHDSSPTRTVEGDDGRSYTIPTRVMAHCTCPMGQWMRSKTGGDVLRRIPDFADVQSGKSRLLTFDPTADRVQGP